MLSFRITGEEKSSTSDIRLFEVDYVKDLSNCSTMVSMYNLWLLM